MRSSTKTQVPIPTFSCFWNQTLSSYSFNILPSFNMAAHCLQRWREAGLQAASLSTMSLDLLSNPFPSYFYPMLWKTGVQRVLPPDPPSAYPARTHLAGESSLYIGEDKVLAGSTAPSLVSPSICLLSPSLFSFCSPWVSTVCMAWPILVLFKNLDNFSWDGRTRPLLFTETDEDKTRREIWCISQENRKTRLCLWRPISQQTPLNLL